MPSDCYIMRNDDNVLMRVLGLVKFKRPLGQSSVSARAGRGIRQTHPTALLRIGSLRDWQRAAKSEPRVAKALERLERGL